MQIILTEEEYKQLIPIDQMWKMQKLYQDTARLLEQLKYVIIISVRDKIITEDQYNQIFEKLLHSDREAL